MTRLVIFIAFLTATASVLVLKKYRHLPSQNVYFDYEVAKKNHEDKIAQIQAAVAPVSEMADEPASNTNKFIEIALDTPELKRGHEVYTAVGKCNTCHGNYGEGKTSQKAPRLANQFEWYVYDQLVNMKAGVRVNAKMNPYLKNLTEQDFKAVANYLSKMHPIP
jgi:cytochrome c553